MPFPKGRSVQAEVDLFSGVQAADLWGTLASLMGVASAAAPEGEAAEERRQRELAEKASEVLRDFCEEYPAYRVAPSAAALEALSATCADEPAGRVALTSWEMRELVKPSPRSTARTPFSSVPVANRRSTRSRDSRFPRPPFRS